MRVCLYNQVNIKYLKKADEIKFFDLEENNIIATAILCPEATIVIYLLETKDAEWWNRLILLRENIQNEILLNLFLFDENNLAKTLEYNFKFFFNEEICSFYQLNDIINLNPEYVYLGAPLFFMMDAIKAKNIKVRAIPNLSLGSKDINYSGNIAKSHGTWIRPEDLHLYEDYIDIIEFVQCRDIHQEEALYRIYIEDQEWPGELKDIIFDLDLDVTNRLIDPSFGSKRLNCRQKCEENNSCHICERMLILANEKKVRDYLDKIMIN